MTGRMLPVDLRILLFDPDGDPLTFEEPSQLVGDKIVPDQRAVETRLVRLRHSDGSSLAKPPEEVAEPADAKGLKELITLEPGT